MTDDLIGPQPEGPKYPTPWQASNWGNLEDANGNTLYFPANGVPLKESRKLGPAIVDAVNAYYGGTGPLQDTWVKACRDLDAKDARIVNLEGRSQVAEERVKKLEKESQERDKHWAIMVREVDKRDARIAELEKRAEAAEARVNLFQRYHQEDLDEIAALGKRAEAAEASEAAWSNTAAHHEMRRYEAEARVRDLEHQLEGATKSLEEARGRVKWLEVQIKQYDSAWAAQLGVVPVTWFGGTPDTFTAPDGRVFRVGQRVQDSMKPERIGTIRKFDLLSQEGQTPVVIRMDDGSKPHYNPEFLRRVWDGTEEPDVPVGTVIRGADSMCFRNDGDGFWELWHSGTGKWSTPLPWNEWDHSEEVRPYIEWLPGDD